MVAGAPRLWSPAHRLGGRDAGFNTYILQTPMAPWGDVGLEVRKTGARYPFASTQHHHSMEEDISSALVRSPNTWRIRNSCMRWIMNHRQI